MRRVAIEVALEMIAINGKNNALVADEDAGAADRLIAAGREPRKIVAHTGGLTP
jgi:hypothetical protein